MAEAFGVTNDADHVAGNKKYDELRAGADPENLASLRVLEKQGFRKSLLLKEHITRPTEVARGKKVKSDIQMLWLPRPGT